MAVPALKDEPETAAMKERERFAQILILFGRHGLKGLSAKLGLGTDQEEPLNNTRPEAVVALLRDIGVRLENESMVTPVFATPILTTSWLA